ncbi:hypothetical protein AEM51_13030 [Bacteroidetes bacterium UKL13-3]|nr:hypothetical protein AEM51_13030 [Bacteroidetes bacterium UKL13-3]
MLKRFYTLVCLLLFSLIHFTASADHVVGSDITYKCTSTPGVFEVTFVFYRACTGIPVCPQTCGAACTRTLQIFGADPSCASSNFGSFQLSLVSVRDVGGNPDCPNAKSICTNMNCVAAGSYTPAIERYEFKGFANIGPTSGIPTTCCNVRFAFTECCRNAEINTGATWQNFYVDAVVNRCLSVSPCNSSPELSNDPFAVMCGGENYVFNNGAVDPDFDSLSFAFAPALQAFNSSVTYSAPWAFNRPMPWSGDANAEFPGGIRCDPLTGDISFTPGNAGGQNFYGIMCIEVKQWKTINGVPTVIGITRRDIQMVVLANCPPNNTPRLITNPPNGSNPNAPKTSWETCAGEQLCFTVTAKDTDFIPPLISDTTYLSWNASIASLGATFKPTYSVANRRKPAPLGGPREDEWQFCWTPTDNQVSNNPYYFTVSAKDNRCPNPGRVTRAFSVKVLGRADLQINPGDLKCGKFQPFYTNKKPSIVPQLVQWQISRFPGDFSLSNNPYAFTNVSTCPVIQYSEPGKYLVLLTATTQGSSGIMCTRVFYDTLRVDTIVKPIVRDTINCAGGSVPITATAKYGKAPYTYRWYNNLYEAGTALPPLNAPVFANGNMTVAPTSTRYYTIRVQDLDGCFRFDSVRVRVTPLPVGLLPDSSRICYGDTFTLDPGNNTGNMKKYEWSTSDTTRTIQRWASGLYTVKMTDTVNCVQYDTMQLYVNNQIFPNAGLDTTICFGDTARLRASGGQLYQWRDLSTGTIVRAKGYNPNVGVRPLNTATTTAYEVRVYNSQPDTAAKYKECSVTDTVLITVKPLPILTRPQATPTCRSGTVVNLPGFGTNQAGPGSISLWSYSKAPGAIINSGTQVRINSLQNNPNKDTIGVFDNWITYKYTAPQTFGGCTATDSANIRIYGNPKVDAGATLVWCENAGVYNITFANRRHSPSGGSTGEGEEWTGPGVTTTPVGISGKRFDFNPLAAGVQKIPTVNVVTYKYTQTYNKSTPTEISCFNSDTVQFNVTSIPIIDAGSDITVCKNEPLFNIKSKTGATLTTSTGVPYAGAPQWIAANAALNNDNAIRNSGQDFFAGSTAITFANSTTNSVYKLYYVDKSTGCEVRDSMNLRVARVPIADLRYNNRVADSLFVCQNTRNVYFRPFASNPIGIMGTTQVTSNLQFSGSASFGDNPDLTVNTSRGVFNSQTASPGLHLLIMKYTDKSVEPINGCTATDTNIIYVQAQPTIQIASINAICSYDSLVQLSLTTAPIDTFDYAWRSGGDGILNTGTTPASYRIGQTDIQNGQVTLSAVTQKKTYGLYATTNGDQCDTVTSSTVLTINRAPDATILSENIENCVPFTPLFGSGATGVQNANFTWTWENEPGITDTDNDSMTQRTITDYQTTTSGIHRLQLTVSTNTTPACTSTSKWTMVTAHAVPEADFEADPPFTTIAKPFFNFINKSTIIDGSKLSYLWNLGPGPDPTRPENRKVTDANPVNIEYAADTAQKDVTLYVTSEYGCIDSVTNKIRINPDITVFIPNAFRPDSKLSNCDGDIDCNRKFKVIANGHLSVEVFVFNRWGQLVFKTTNANEGWDGKMINTSEDCPQEVYIYQVNATSFSGKLYRYSGSVTLLR